MGSEQITVKIDAALLLHTMKYARAKGASLKTFRFSLERVRVNAVIRFLDILIEEFEEPNETTIDVRDLPWT